MKCPITDHGSNGKVERLIRTINKRLGTNKKVVLDKDNTGLSELLYTLRKAPKIDKLSPAEQYFERKLPTLKNIITTKPKNYNVSENDIRIRDERLPTGSKLWKKGQRKSRSDLDGEHLQKTKRGHHKRDATHHHNDRKKRTGHHNI